MCACYFNGAGLCPDHARQRAELTRRRRFARAYVYRSNLGRRTWAFRCTCGLSQGHFVSHGNALAIACEHLKACS